jgi:CheY-like chemotaxis protein
MRQLNRGAGYKAELSPAVSCYDGLPAGGFAVVARMPRLTIRVVIADDQALVRSGLPMILATDPDIEVVGQAHDRKGAVAEVEPLRPDEVIMDIPMAGTDGLAAAAAVASNPRSSACRVVLLTTYGLDEYLFGPLQAGATDFLELVEHGGGRPPAAATQPRNRIAAHPSHVTDVTTSAGHRCLLRPRRSSAGTARWSASVGPIPHHRPPSSIAPKPTVELIFRLARENTRWGYLRIRRRAQEAWCHGVQDQARLRSVATDLFNVDTLLLRRYYGFAPPGIRPAPPTGRADLEQVVRD